MFLFKYILAHVFAFVKNKCLQITPVFEFERKIVKKMKKQETFLSVFSSNWHKTKVKAKFICFL